MHLSKRETAVVLLCCGVQASMLILSALPRTWSVGQIVACLLTWEEGEKIHYLHSDLFHFD